ncbi:type VI secretion system protein TssA [Aquisalimonas sp. 2447]|uniref:type VI secretion system protein TssA n=1 Tax=Aquisalimonas sp. 2447 TaxID=2740807 RepID=UPI0014327375|nr:type VI secretion system protein TssA [Aquisalimonas sp. 2447]QIT55979.1 type VI secretion system protein TssA [Aquisalimonas sp. 2447]
MSEPMTEGTSGDSPFFDILDIPGLLLPVTDDAPTGQDLRLDDGAASSYHALRNARGIARNQERDALESGETDQGTPAEWREVLETAPEVLRNESKDLEVVTWLIEALCRTHGFRGVAAGFCLARQLLETFGEGLHPQPDEDGKPSQLIALTGLNGVGSEGALIPPLKSLRLTDNAPPGPFCTWQCEQAFELEKITDPDKRAARIKRGYVALEDILQAVGATSTPVLQATDHDIRQAISEFHRYSETLDRYCADDPQPTGRIADTLDNCRRMVAHLAGDRIQVVGGDTQADAANDADDEAGDDEAAPAPGEQQGRRQMDREAALRQLREVAEFFRRTEPHSPVSYAIEQAVRWSQMPLPDLLAELIPDDGARQKYRTLAGIRDDGG